MKLPVRASNNTIFDALNRPIARTTSSVQGRLVARINNNMPDIYVLTTGAFMAVGLMHGEAVDKMLDHWGGGQLELVNELMTWAPYTCMLSKAALEVFPDHCPGVWSYEVDEEFGHWYRDALLAGPGSGVPPESAACRAKLKGLVTSFYSNGLELEEPAILHTLTQALDAVVDCPY